MKLNGAMELAPSLGLSQRIVDLVSSGATLKANGLVEIEHVADVTSRLIVKPRRAENAASRAELLDQEVRGGGAAGGGGMIKAEVCKLSTYR